ncbi:hypothetical protein [Methanomethylophilus alvi]|uniref:hypothetical protein n=1 Tax=Methanomethylophilus alvi TaxID=1291540 RepID=UPI0037DCBBB3
MFLFLRGVVECLGFAVVVLVVYGAALLVDDLLDEFDILGGDESVKVGIGVGVQAGVPCTGAYDGVQEIDIGLVDVCVVVCVSVDLDGGADLGIGGVRILGEGDESCGASSHDEDSDGHDCDKFAVHDITWIIYPRFDFRGNI